MTQSDRNTPRRNPSGGALRTTASNERHDRAEALCETYRNAHPEAALEAAIHSVFPGKIALVSSFGADAVVLLHMVSRVEPALPIIFLDTLQHFPQTLAYRDEVVEALGLTNVKTQRPVAAAVKAEDPDGTLHATHPDMCCHVRKTLPMLRALSGLDCWITGRKSHQTADRQGLPLFEAQDRWIKLNPLHDWSADDVVMYRELNELPAHPLIAQNYRSIGCAPCTAKVAPGEDARAGRWKGQTKTECGIHLTGGKVARRAAGGC